MARINLLPWREELRQQKKKEFLIAIGVAVVFTLIIMGLVHLHIEGMKDYQSERNKRLDDEITKVDRQIDEIKTIDEKKAKLLSKIDLIQKLQESRPEIVHLFDELPRITPDGVYLTQFTQKDKSLTFEGKSQSNARVSALMRSIDASQWMNSPVLKIIELNSKANPDRLSNFVLQAKQGKKVIDPVVSPNKDDKRQTDEAETDKKAKGGKAAKNKPAKDKPAKDKSKKEG